jgi:hypothetical protein
MTSFALRMKPARSAFDVAALRARVLPMVADRP